jgi:hypothetical protein
LHHSEQHQQQLILAHLPLLLLLQVMQQQHCPLLPVSVRPQQQLLCLGRLLLVLLVLLLLQGPQYLQPAPLQPPALCLQPQPQPPPQVATVLQLWQRSLLLVCAQQHCQALKSQHC